MHDADFWIERLGLEPHPEGGHFVETYRSAESIADAALPDRFSGPRSICTAIHFLLQRHDVSALHRIRSDELWHFHAGAPLSIHTIDLEGAYRHIRLGPDPDAGHAWQIAVPAGVWFGGEVAGGTEADYALVSCTVAPGFDFADFELASRASLLAEFPQHHRLITRMTRA